MAILARFSIGSRPCSASLGRHGPWIRWLAVALWFVSIAEVQAQAGSFIPQPSPTAYFPPNAQDTGVGLAANTIFTVPFTSTIKWDTPMATWTMALFQNKPGNGADQGNVSITTGGAGAGSFVWGLSSLDELGSKYKIPFSTSNVYFLWVSTGMTGGVWGGDGQSFTSNYFNLTGPKDEPAPAPPPAAVITTTTTTTTTTASSVSSQEQKSQVAANPTVPSSATQTQAPSTPFSSSASKSSSDSSRSSSAPSSVPKSTSATTTSSSSGDSAIKITSTSSSSTRAHQSKSDASSTTNSTTTTSTSSVPGQTISSTSTTSTDTSVQPSDGAPADLAIVGPNGYASPSNSSIGGKTGKTGKNKDASDDQDNSPAPAISGGAKAGIVVGVVVCLAMLVPLVFFLIRKYGLCRKNSDDDDDQDGLTGNAFTGAYGDARGSGQRMSNGDVEQVTQHNGGSWLGAGAFTKRFSNASGFLPSPVSPGAGSPIERQPTVPFVVANPDLPAPLTTNPYTGASPSRQDPFADSMTPQDGFGMAAAAGAAGVAGAAGAASRQNPFGDRTPPGSNPSPFGTHTSSQRSYASELQHSNSASSFQGWQPTPSARDSRVQLEDYLRYGDRPPVQLSDGNGSPMAMNIHEADPDAVFNPTSQRYEIPDDQRIMIQRFQELEAGSSYPMRSLSNASAPGGNKPLPFPVRHPSNASRVAPSMVRSIQELDSTGLI